MISFDPSTLKSWEFAAKAGFVAVIVGVAIEVVDILAKWFERCGGKRLPKAFRNWILPIETAGFLILVIGLAVEFWGSQNAQLIADRQNAMLNDRASTNELQVAKLNKETADAKLESDKIQLKLASLEPIKQPIESITANVRLVIVGKGDWQRPSNTNDWTSLISFFNGKFHGSDYLSKKNAGQNVLSFTGEKIPQTVFTLCAIPADTMIQDLFGKNKIVYDITFHNTHIALANAGLGKPANIFNGVNCWVLQLPQISTNTFIVTGSVSVTINSALSWSFDIPPQQQRNDIITSEITTNYAGKAKAMVMPLHVVEEWGKHKTYLFDGN